MSERNIPFVCFGRVDDPTVQWVDVDGAAGIRAAVTHVYQQGHERLAFVGWPKGSAAGDDRFAGFTTEVESLEMRSYGLVRVVNDFDAARKSVADLMRQSDPTAIVCVSDTLALGVMAGLRDLGMVAGRDVAVTGFDDIPAASLTAPGLTSLRQPMNTVGTLLVERLVARLLGENPPSSMLVEADLIVRESTAGTVPDKQEENP
ncbi:MAG: substrate-binding domain-containing protein [Actinobacteria bacterium]|nr:substrate-binding domain-containing protein [Actinomycetota bacterium]